MSLQTYLPHPALLPYVQMLWFWPDYLPGHPRERILPGGMMEITINLRDEPLHFYDPLRMDQPQSIVGPVAAGARSESFIVDTARPASILAVWFKPGGARQFFGVSAAEMHNAHIPLADVWGTAAGVLYDRLLAAQTTGQRFRILETALLQRLQHGPERHRAVHYALSAFSNTPHATSIAAVTSRIALSPTRFIQVFREDTGLTPKLYCRLQRFQRALRLIAGDSAPRWTDVALACGYYDQSHFINDFQAFAGIRPTDYQPQSREHNLNLPFWDGS